MKTHWKRLAAAGAAALLMWQAVPVFGTTVAQYDEQISEVKQAQAANAAEAEQLNAQLDDLRGKTEKAEEYQRTLEEKIQNHQERIDLARERIDELNDSITYLEGELEKADAEYADAFVKLKERLHALYISGGELTSLQILMDSTSLYDYALRSETVKSVTRHDTLLMEEIKAYMLSTQKQREELNAQKEELAEQKKSLEAAQAELQALEEENAALIEELNLQTAQTESAIAENEAESADFLASLESLIAARNEQERRDEEAREAAEAAQQAAAGNGGNFSDPSVLNTGSLSFAWPLSGYGKNWITQHYGGMFSGTPHMGLDIGVPYGTPIYAAEAGEVLSAEYHWSWGNNVLVWHNSTYSTRYAHMSSMAVSAGQYVVKGQLLGYVGETGNAFGAHLHFEVYQNGSRVNPEMFV